MHLGLKVLLYKNRQTGQDFAIKIQDAANKAMFENETLLLRTAQGSSFVTKLCGVFSTKVSISMRTFITLFPNGFIDDLYASARFAQGKFNYLPLLEKKSG